MNLIQSFKALKRDFILKNNIAQLENDLTAWFITKYNESKKDFREIISLDMQEARHYLWKQALNPAILDYSKTISHALKNLVLLHNFERPLVTDKGLIYLQRKVM